MNNLNYPKICLHFLLCKCIRNNPMIVVLFALSKFLIDLKNSYFKYKDSFIPKINEFYLKFFINTLFSSFVFKASFLNSSLVQTGNLVLQLDLHFFVNMLVKIL